MSRDQSINQSAMSIQSLLNIKKRVSDNITRNFTQILIAQKEGVDGTKEVS